MTHYGSLFFACFLRNAEACIIGERSGRSGRARQRVRYRTARTAATSCLVGSLVIPDFCLNLITFIYTHILLVMQTFSLSCFSSSHRGGGVAPDCMDFALKASFPWLQAPFRLRSGVFSHPEWVATQFNLFFYLREIEDFEGVRRMSEATDRPTRTENRRFRSRFTWA